MHYDHLIKNQIHIGSTIRLTEDVNRFKKGHIFKVFDCSYRGWDLIDSDGNEMVECLFIHDKLELFDIKKERREKLFYLKKND